MIGVGVAGVPWVMGYVFVSYAREDEAFVIPLAEGLKRDGVRLWLDQWDIPPSADWDRSIDDALYDCASFLIVLSPTSVESREVRAELRTALDANKPIVTVLCKECRIPRYLRLLQFIDFSQRSHDDESGLAQIKQALGVTGAEEDTGRGDPRFVSLSGMSGEQRANLDFVLDRYEVFMEWLHGQAGTPERQENVRRRVRDYRAVLDTSCVFSPDAYRALLADLDHLAYILREVFVEAERRGEVKGTSALLEAAGQAVDAIESLEELLY